ncbi:hypothetical protein M514_10681 [Trichuris suis]|uniref:Uncharacterized protein n=1 Tax=Trichuris suis TaxID=68888 RepID=A0A085MY35_9BILA|nr:hypothetical protein M513_10681 [Trichuris suis]KFD62131.1 hypothetical protein M514_10681 [Trichuris suis]
MWRPKILYPYQPKLAVQPRTYLSTRSETTSYLIPLGESAGFERATERILKDGEATCKPDLVASKEENVGQ